MKKRILIWSTVGFFVFACTSDSESDLIPGDTTNATVTYVGTVRSIISSNCLSCHSDPPINGAPFALDTYQRVRTIAENGGLLSVISRQTGDPGAMPPTGRMPQATINQIDSWIKAGYPEN